MSKSTNKEKALSALLSHNTIRDAATESGLSEATFYRLLKEPDFKSEYRTRRREVVEASIGSIQQATTEAIETLRRNLNCGNKNVEVRAAAIILDNALRGVELTDILERLEDLENGFNKQD